MRKAFSTLNPQSRQHFYSISSKHMKNIKKKINEDSEKKLLYCYGVFKTGRFLWCLSFSAYDDMSGTCAELLLLHQCTSCRICDHTLLKSLPSVDPCISGNSKRVARRHSLTFWDGGSHSLSASRNTPHKILNFKQYYLEDNWEIVRNKKCYGLTKLMSVEPFLQLMI